MKKIFSYLLLALALPFMAACDSDIDSNPTLQEPEPFVLNLPPYATNNLIDLQYAQSLELTTNQPAYGFTAATTYTVQVTLADAFVEAAEATETTEAVEANYVSLPTTYRTARMNVDAFELSEAIVALWDAANSGADLPAEMPVTLRLRANVTGFDRGVCYSNAITLPRVHVTKPAQALALPEKMFLVGGMPASGWSTWLPMAQVYATPGMFYGVVYCPANTNFKFSPEAGDWEQARSYSTVEFTEEAKTLAGVELGTDNDNIAVRNGGWYTMVVTTKIVGKEIRYIVDIRQAEVYLCGNSMGEWGFIEAGKFTAPEGDGEWVSPAAKGSGEARMCVKVPDAEWWMTEFTLLDGATVFYRETDNLLNGWGEDKGSNYSVQLSAGQKVHINFSAGTGFVE